MDFTQEVIRSTSCCVDTWHWIKKKL